MTNIVLYEVGPRDGLQNEQKIVPTAAKVDFINRLSETGLKKIEVTSFVSPKWVPQMADNSIVMAAINRAENIVYSALVPNDKGMIAALDTNVKEIAIFTSASESFCNKNINCSVSESIKRFEQVMALAKSAKIKVRGYVSCATHCPYEGVVDPIKVTKVSETLIDIGCYEVSLGDTIGKATPKDIKLLLQDIRNAIDLNNIALHCHDTYGQALANILTGIEMGVSTFDSSVAGLGGCPYAKGASGNVATEDVLYMLNGLGLKTDVSLDKIIDVAWFISKKLNRTPNSKVAIAQKH